LNGTRRQTAPFPPPGAGIATGCPTVNR
jgi:hypothetical protein